MVYRVGRSVLHVGWHSVVCASRTPSHSSGSLSYVSEDVAQCANAERELCARRHDRLRAHIAWVCVSTSFCHGKWEMGSMLHSIAST